MKHFIYSLLIIGFCCVTATAQRNKATNDKNPASDIVISAYTEGYDNASTKLLHDKLLRISTMYGIGGSSFDHRFIITPHIVELESTTTGTIPARTVTNYSISLYIGDIYENTVLSSYNTEIKALGKSKNDALKNAVKKLNVHDPDIEFAIETAKQRIIDYYNSKAESIITNAKSMANAGDYLSAAGLLSSIPSFCTEFEEAQSLCAKYAKKHIDETNNYYMRNAETAWSTSPDINGANNVFAILSNITLPNDDIEKRIKSLNSKMNDRIKALDQREWQQQQDMITAMLDEAKQIRKDEHAENMAFIEAVKSCDNDQKSDSKNNRKKRSSKGNKVEDAYNNKTLVQEQIITWF